MNNAPASLRCRLGPTLFAALCLLAAVPAAAQQVFRGKVIDYETFKPLADVEVTLVTAASLKMGSVRTDTLGMFVITARGPGNFKFQARKIGYREGASAVVRIERDQTLQVEITMSPVAIVIAPLAIVGKTTNKLGDPLDPMWGYSFRKNMGFGTFLEYAEILERRPTHFTDLMRQIPGVRTITGTDTVYFNRMVSTRAELCQPGVFLDGFPLHDENPYEQLNLLLPDGIEAVEVYKSNLQVPGEFAGTFSDCGAIVVWRKR